MMKMLLMAGVSALAVSAGSASATVVFNYSGSIVDWTAPRTGEYVIDAYGAQGGTGSGYGYSPGGLGVGVGGTFMLTKGETLEIALGGTETGPYYFYYTGSGGGGSFVATSDGAPLIVAGGGGGSPFAGTPGGNATPVMGNGQGGSGFGGGGGGGFYSDGGSGYGFEPGIHSTYSTGGGGGFPRLAGGGGVYSGGGFGGGGGGGYNAGGGGGGFGGGAGGGGFEGGSGGSSFDSGTHQSVLGYRSGDGLVSISAIPEPSTWSLMLSGLGFLGYVLRRRVRRTG